MTRRELLRLSGSSLLYTGLAPLMSFAGKPTHAGSGGLYFTKADIPRIRANTKTALLKPLYDEWAAMPLSDIKETLDKFLETENIVYDFPDVLRKITQAAMVQILEPSKEREKAILQGVEGIIARPHWDYFRDGGEEVLGIQRASFTTVELLFIREALGDGIDPEFDKRFLKAIADKGCAPCYATLYDMEHPDTVKGWGFDEKHAGFYDITMEKWPIILGANNLRSAPHGALGLGALALRGHDDRAEEWLRMAVQSQERFLKLFSPDGSYFEGLSYLDYSLRTSLPFIDAHRRLVGDIDWLSKVNFNGVLDYIMTMQLGKTPDGQPDIVNFSDARGSVHPGAISLIGQYTGNEMAGYVARNAGRVIFFHDFLWYRPDAPAKPPRKELLNMRNDLNWIICRSGWKADDSVIAFKSGAPANHEHADRNHFIFKAHGERLLNDHLGASYDRRKPGWKMRFTRGHNAVLIDGKGHPYLDGEHGTNDTKAFANILNYEDHGRYVWWTSDASAAYILDNYHVHQVLRSVLFAKPDVLVVVDQIRLRYRPQTIDLRYYPDNADGLAGLAVNGNRFTISRPNAELHGLIASDCMATPRMSRLEVPEETGDFPCVEVHSPEGLTHHIVTVLATKPGSNTSTPDMNVSKEDSRWTIQAGKMKARVTMTSYEPTIEIL